MQQINMLSNGTCVEVSEDEIYIYRKGIIGNNKLKPHEEVFVIN